VFLAERQPKQAQEAPDTGRHSSRGLAGEEEKVKKAA